MANTVLLGATPIRAAIAGTSRIRKVAQGSTTLWDLVPSSAEMAAADTAAGALEAALLAGTVSAKVLTPSKNAYLTKRDANTYYGYIHLGAEFWAELQFSTGGVSGGPYSWNQTRLLPIYGFILAASATPVYTGSWALTQGAGVYLSGTAKQTSVVNDQVSIIFSGGGDVWAVFTGRSAGNWVKVTIDGADPVAGSGNGLSTLPSTAGVGFDTYTSVDLQYKQKVKLATGLSSASHTIVLKQVADKTSGSTVGSNRFNFNALALVNSASGTPDDATSQPPVWITGHAYAQFDEVRYRNNYYSCTVAGTSGATPPTHTTGSASDGGVTWTFLAKSTYALLDHYIQAAGSQLEYACEIQPAGATTLGQFGGVIHGHETLNSLTVQLGGVNQSAMALDAWLNAADVEIVQQITATHAEVSGSVCETTLTHKLEPAKCTVSHTHTWQKTTATLGWFYAAMWPLLAYHGPKIKWVFDTITSPADGDRVATDFWINALPAGTVNPIVGRLPDLLMAGIGNVFMADGTSSGTPTVYTPAAKSTGTHKCRAWLRVARTSVNDYQTGRMLRAGKAMNLASVATAPTASSQVTKLYFERADEPTALVVNAGDVWNCQGVYNVRLEAL